MVLTDQGHRLLIATIERLRESGQRDKVSQRQLAKVVGYKTHTYMGKLLRREVKTMEPEAALRLSRYFGQPVDSLFLIGASSTDGPIEQQHTAA